MCEMPGSALTSITAHSRRQAMDWSLVLVSQGIESTLEADAEERLWFLWVEPADYERALAAIRQYRLENRGVPWRRQVKPGVLFDGGSIAWLLLILLFYWLEQNHGLRAPGLMDSTKVSEGQWWRLFTAVWLHADLAHLAANAASGVVLLGLAMGRFGTGIGLVSSILAGAGGNVFGWLLGEAPHRSLGASGLVMGCLGLIAAQSLELWPAAPNRVRYVWGGVFAGIMLFVLMGLSPGTDVLAHLGGFVCGLALGGALCLIKEIAERTALQFWAGALFVASVLLPWWLAMASS
jgi:membrane associated rhomboid family serine protease